jgi:hypothetical protein
MHICPHCLGAGLALIVSLWHILKCYGIKLKFWKQKKEIPYFDENSGKWHNLPTVEDKETH